MASLPLINVKLWRGGIDASGRSNQADLKLMTEALDDTGFGSTARLYVPGLDSVQFSHAGRLEYGAGNIEAALWDAQGTADEIFSVAVDSDADGAVGVGDRAYVFRHIQSTLSRQGTPGQIHTFTVTAEGSGPHGRGMVLEAGVTARAATFNGAAAQVGAVAATETLMGALHVLAASGTLPTLDVVVQSDSTSGFSSPATALTFTQQSAVGSEWQSAAGAVTDTYYRVAVTIGGTDPSFTFAVCLGLGAT